MIQLPSCFLDSISFQTSHCTDVHTEGMTRVAQQKKYYFTLPFSLRGPNSTQVKLRYSTDGELTIFFFLTLRPAVGCCCCFSSTQLSLSKIKKNKKKIEISFFTAACDDIRLLAFHYLSSLLLFLSLHSFIFRFFLTHCGSRRGKKKVVNCRLMLLADENKLHFRLTFGSTGFRICRFNLLRFNWEESFLVFYISRLDFRRRHENESFFQFQAKFLRHSRAETFPTSHSKYV